MNDDSPPRLPTRPLGLDALRAFEAVARRLSFSAAGDELHLTQSAISRQIKSLETELGAPLFSRGTRKVELTSAGETLRQAVLPALERIDRAVRQIRTSRGRRQVNLTTFASFATLWLLPRLPAFQQAHPDIDIRISASDAVVEEGDPEIDLALRHVPTGMAPAGARPLFDEWVAPVASPALLWQARHRHAPPLNTLADLAGHTLIDEDDRRTTTLSRSWRRYLAQQGQPTLEPRRWIIVNYTHQQVQGALAGQGVALARLALVVDQLQRGELVEPFGTGARLPERARYWLVPIAAAGGAQRVRPEVQAFSDWVLAEAALTQAALASEAGPGPGTDPDAPSARPAGAG